MPHPQTILAIDDQKSELDQLRRLLEGNYQIIGATSGSEAISLFREHNVDLVLLDVILGDMDGMGVLRMLRKFDEQVPVIMMSGVTKINTVVECMKLGANDYITKPVNEDEIRHAVSRALAEAARQKRLAGLQEQIQSEHRFDDFIGETPAMKAVFSQIEKLKGNQTSVLITGESGTGKEMVAKAIHKTTAPAGSPYLAINCGAIPSELFESELFGHEAGAFTGAVGRKIGKVELAQDGTLFLDELGTMPLSLQVKLLRVLEERMITRVGGNKQIPVSFRLISATNSDLEKGIATGNFREDLYYRINVIHIDLPPLRERTDDIPLLADYFIKQHAAPGKPPRVLTEAAIERLKNYPWKGNVRELENVIERAMILSSGESIESHHLPLGDTPTGPPRRRKTDRLDDGVDPAELRAGRRAADPYARPPIQDGFALHDYLDSLEKAYIEEALAKSGGHKEKAAAMLGIHRNTLTRRMAHFKMK